MWKLHEIKILTSINKVSWNTAKLIYLCLAYGYFCAIKEVVTEPVGLTLPKICTIWLSREKNLLTPSLGETKMIKKVYSIYYSDFLKKKVGNYKY